jgi:hypothetical protein
MRRLAFSLTAALFVSGSLPACDAAGRTGNLSHDVLMEAADDDRRATLAAVLEASGRTCPASRRIFFQGLGADREARWSVECWDGQAYTLTLPFDPNEPGQVLTCEAAAATNPCFEPLP